MTAVTFDNLTLGYGRHPAVHHLAAEVPEGSLTAIVGPNGAGKSTLLKGMTGVLAPLEGRVRFGTVSSQDIAYLPQKSDIDLTFPLSVLDLVSMGLWKQVGAFGRLRRSHRARAAEALEAVGLGGFEKRSMGSLSGGQVQRVLFARLLLQDAKMVLLDEPFSAVDARTVADLIEVIRSWHTEGRTVMAVLHDHETVLEHFPDTMMLSRELVAHGPTSFVMTRQNHAKAQKMSNIPDGPPHICEVSAA